MNISVSIMYTCIDRYRYLCICNRTQVPRLRKCLQPYLLRREKEEVEKLLPAKKEIIVEVEMSQLQRLYIYIYIYIYIHLFLYIYVYIYVYIYIYTNNG